MKINRSIDIYAPGKTIWPFLVEPERISKWCLPAKKFDRNSVQQNGIGTTFYFEERAAGRLMKLNFVVTEWVINKSVAFKMTDGNFVTGYEQRYTIENTGSVSRCTCFEYVKLPYGIIGHTALLLRRHFSEKLLDAMLSRLKILAEA
jgi:hypothetical protein